MNRWHYDSANDLGQDATQRHRSLHRENELAQNLLRLGWLASLRLVFKLWNRLEIRGLENVPLKPPFIITANHASHLDALVIAATLPLRWRDQISPLAAGDYFFRTAPRAGFSAMVLNALPLWRHRKRGVRHGLGDLRNRLQEQSAIYIIFPEGSRSRDGEPHEFKPGFATLVAGTPIPVLPCHLSGSFSALPPGQHLVRPHRIRLQIGTPVTFETIPNRAEGWRQICACIHEQTLRMRTATPAVTKHHQGRWRNKLILTFRFSRLLARRQLRNLTA